MSDVTVTGLGTYRNETPYPFCPGCGHGPILDHLNQALVKAGIAAEHVVIVSDIGCSGLSDQYFATHAFHGLHGRSLTYATGIKLVRPDLCVIVVIGDGGTGIGGTHLLQAARRNLGITVLVFDNFNFGMTGGQHSVTTPSGAFTSTTPLGNLERPLDLCATVAVNGASYVWRGTSFDSELSDRIAEALATPGFALLDVWELCTAHFVAHNAIGKRTLTELADKLGFQTGLVHKQARPEYAAAYREAMASTCGQPLRPPRRIPLLQPVALARPFRLVAAGSAGGKVRSATRLLAEAAVLSGLWVTQREDYPVTVKSGHSIAELVISPDEVLYTGIDRPDAMVLLSNDGLKKSGGMLRAMDKDGRVFALPGLPMPVTDAPVEVLTPGSTARLKPDAVGLFALAAAVRRLGLLPRSALDAAAKRSSRAEANLATIAAAFAD